MQKRILILTAGFGEGHNAAARGIRDGLAAVTGDQAGVEVHDLFAETYGLANDWSRKAYLAIINRAPRAWEWIYHWVDGRDQFAKKLRFLFLLRNRLRRLLDRFRPDVVVSVFPAYPPLLEEIGGRVALSFQQVVCVTDSITVNAIWFRCATALFLVPNEQTAAVLATAGVPNERMRVTGFPVTPKFAQLGDLRQPPSSEYGRRVLYMINPGRIEAPEIICGLAQLTDVRLTVTVGRSDRLRRMVEAVRNAVGCKFDIIGWSDQLPRLMLESHLLISKAGGATVQETIAAKCPMIINQVVPGQEEGNARLIEETHSGVVATTPNAIIACVQKAFADDARQWREWSENMSRLSRPAASFDIAQLLLTLDS
jgi:processive 1,2-diacylglycerol beta-glucosyltransferase